MDARAEWFRQMDEEAVADEPDPSGASEQTDASANGVQLDDFWSYMPQHRYIFAPTRELWPAESINGRLPPVPVLDDAGNAMLGRDGKPLMMRHRCGSTGMPRSSR